MRSRYAAFLLIACLLAAATAAPAARSGRATALEPAGPEQHVQQSVPAGNRAAVQRAAPRTERMPFVAAPAHAPAAPVGLERIHLPRPASPRAAAGTFSSQRDPPASRSI